MKYLIIFSFILSCNTQKSSKIIPMPKIVTTEVKTIEYQANESDPDPLYDAINTLDEELIQKTATDRSKLFSLNSFNKSGSSPLTHFLIVSADEEIDRASVTKELIKIGANPNFKTSLGLSPLSISIQNNYPDVVKVLLENGADPTEILQDGKSLLQLAENLKRSEIIIALKQYL